MNIALFKDATSQASSKQMPGNNTMLCGRYTQEHILGVGGMGVVYRGVDTMRQAFGAASNYIAIKMACAEHEDNPGVDNLLFTEYEIGSRLRHTNLVAIRHFDVCRQQQKAFLIMDWIEGLSLEELLYRQPLPPDIALHLSRQLVDAVSFCHQQGVVHGDIKPANIIISPNNHLTLFDFGISQPPHTGVRSGPAVAAMPHRSYLKSIFRLLPPMFLRCAASSTGYSVANTRFRIQRMKRQQEAMSLNRYFTAVTCWIRLCCKG